MRTRFLTKLAIIAGLMLGLMIPLSMVKGVVSERSAYRAQTKASIAESWTGAQKFLGPMLIQPYLEKSTAKVWYENLKEYRDETIVTPGQLIILPDVLKISGDIATEERLRGLYAVPVYDAGLAVQGTFSNRALLALLKEKGATIELQAPYVSLIVSDIRGVVTEPVMNWDGNKLEFVAGSGLEKYGNGMRSMIAGLENALAAEYGFDFELHLHGMETLQFSPVGKSTVVDLRSDWKHPSFIGRYLPGERASDPKGFTANWRVSAFSSDMEQVIKQCQSGNCHAFVENTFGVSLINPIDIYQQAERSVKYAVLFITLTFVVFFLFEIMKSLRLHPMQYLLVGASLTVFYLLLISLSEHISFGLAYLIASLANAIVIGVYITAVLQTTRRGVIFTAALSLLYGMLYVILCSEDNALLMGSLLIFGILAMVMVVTRRLDWYEVSEQMVNHAVVSAGAPASAVDEKSTESVEVKW